jgi:UDP-N-acetylglucosamine--N-acetylmuramyl-(pentapeptide) pyrophosphoryl-undecaprenol N-acetylglucosamine transferase
VSALIVIAAGGTGGHFFPAEALAAELLARGHRVALMTDARSGGQNSAVFAQGQRFVIKGAGLAGRGLGQKITAGMGLVAGVLQAWGILRRLKPDAIVAFGGYPSVAPVLAARLLGMQGRVVLHEQNAVLGRANHALSRFAKLVALSFAVTKGLPPGAVTRHTGNPVRPAIAALAGAAYTPPSRTIHLLVLGGSLGARVFSDVLPAALTLLPSEFIARLRLTQQCRAEDLDRVAARYQALGIAAELSPFFADVAGLLRDAHLVIARAGASTVAELAVIGRPAMLVPLPGAIDDHQTANARALSEAGGAVVIAQRSFNAHRVMIELSGVLADPRQLASAATAAAGLGAADATTRLAVLVETIIAGDQP